VALPAELLLRSPEEGARLLALSYLGEATAAHPRVADPDDAEGLHDFRVALRRLRSCIRAYRRELHHELPAKTRRRLRQLSDVTGPGRDLEVQIAWLRQNGKSLPAHHRHGLTWILEQLGEQHAEAFRDLEQEVGRDFAAVEADLRRELSIYRTEIQLGVAPRRTFGDVTAAAVHDHAAELFRLLDQVSDAGDVTRAHRARIAAKRLRYLLDPISDQVTGASAVLKQLKRLQDLLGEFHDAHVLEEELEKLLGQAAGQHARKLLELSLSSSSDEKQIRAARRRPREPGLLALATRNRQRRDELFGRLKVDWLEDGAARLAAEMTGVEEAIAREIAAARAAASGEAGPPDAGIATEDPAASPLSTTPTQLE
jgi:CHAD domain-containing protein